MPTVGPAEDLEVFRRWWPSNGLLDAMRGLYTYGPGDRRATGYLYAEGEMPWPEPLAETGPLLLSALQQRLGARFTVVAFQAYLDGAGCGWHDDSAFASQAILSLGVTRQFGARWVPGGEPEWLSVAHGDLVYMPPGFQAGRQHSVPDEDVTGERVSLVFRTVVR